MELKYSCWLSMGSLHSSYKFSVSKWLILCHPFRLFFFLCWHFLSFSYISSRLMLTMSNSAFFELFTSFCEWIMPKPLFWFSSLSRLYRVWMSVLKGRGWHELFGRFDLVLYLFCGPWCKTLCWPWYPALWANFSFEMFLVPNFTRYFWKPIPPFDLSYSWIFGFFKISAPISSTIVCFGNWTLWSNEANLWCDWEDIFHSWY